MNKKIKKEIICSNKVCPNYKEKTEKINPPKPFCSMKCKYDDPNYLENNPYAEY